jgi:uncharacterized damage-inducible protein DinB
MDREKAIVRIKTSRQELLQVIQGLSPAQCCTAAVEGTWTVKEVIEHICAWDTSLSHPLRHFLEGEEFTPEVIQDHDAWNLHQVAQRQGKSFAEVLDEAKSTRFELISLTDQLAPVDWERIFQIPWGGRGTLAEMIAGLAWHEREHAKSIASVQIPR